MDRFKKLWELLEKYRTEETTSYLDSFIRHLEYTTGRYKYDLQGPDIYRALVYTVRDTLIKRKNAIEENLHRNPQKLVYYISIEFLLGNLLNVTLMNLGLREQFRAMLLELGFDLDEISHYEPDAGLGNGGLGRLAACFLDSMASQNLPCIGSGLRYDFGMFHQQIVNGFQRELPDNWLSRGNPWELVQNDLIYPIHFFGTTEVFNGRHRWLPDDTVFARAHDILISGYGPNAVTRLRLWSADSSSDFNMDYFQHGNYLKAIEDSIKSSYITKVLYPNENLMQGRELRLKQEYFLVSATIQDALRQIDSDDFDTLPEKVIFHLNDTHPALAIAELMHILVDSNGIPWDRAWKITKNCFAYTNHTIMPEALEKWSVELLDRLLPRHLEIIYALNADFLEGVRKSGASDDVIRNVSIVEEGYPKRIRMANLAIVGSKSVNGVSQMHTDILTKRVFKDFNEIFPGKFQNKTNGISYRRWLFSANPILSELITKNIGSQWICNLDNLEQIEKFADDSEFLAEWDSVKRKNKEALARIIRFECGVEVSPDSIFDIHVKRIHEYKRQLLNALRIIGDYHYIMDNPNCDYHPRTFVFSGKAAPGYHRAKLIIKFINSIAHLVNLEPALKGRMKVVFLPDFRVSLAEKIYPAADISEQISTAGTEASGTGNMKFVLNGAPVVGTPDGANLEILESIGKENSYIFGHSEEGIAELRKSGYDPFTIYREDQEIRRILDMLRNGLLESGSSGMFVELFNSLTVEGDIYFHLADYHLFQDIQKRVSEDFRDRKGWNRRSVLNSARSGIFSADRTVREYASEIWGVNSFGVCK